MYIPSPKLTNTYLLIYLFISTLHQNHLHKDRFLTAVYSSYWSSFAFRCRNPKDQQLKTPKLIFIIIIFYVVLFPNSGPDYYYTDSCLVGSI